MKYFDRQIGFPADANGFGECLRRFDMDLVGLPWQLVVGPRGLASGTVELKRRSTGEKQELSIESALARLTA